MADYGRLVVGVTADTSSMSKSISGAATKAGNDAGANVAKSMAGHIGRSSWGALKSVGNSIATGFTVATTAAAGFGLAAVHAGAALNAAQSESVEAFTAITGSTKAAEQLMGRISTLSTMSVFPKEVFTDAAQQMLGVGTAAKDVVPRLTAVQDAAAALGDRSGQKVQLITSALDRVQATGKFTTRAFASLGAAGVDAAGIIGKQMGITGAQVKARIADGSLGAQKALNALYTGMTDKFGKGARNAIDSWSGVKTTIGKQVANLGSIIVAPFLNKRGGGYVVVWARQVRSMLIGLTPIVKQAMGGITRAIGPTLDKVAPVLRTITTEITRLGNGIKGGQLSGLTSQLGKMQPLLAGLAALFAKGGGNIKAFLGPLGEILPDLNPVLAAFVTLVATTPQLRGAFVEVAKALLPLLPLLTNLVGQVVGALQPAMVKLAPVIVQIGTVLSGVLGQALVRLGPVLVAVAKFIGDLLDHIAPLIPPVLKLAGVILGVAEAILQRLTPLLPPLARMFDQVLAAVKPYVPQLIILAHYLGNVLVGAVRVLVPILKILIPIIGVALVSSIRSTILIIRIINGVIHAAVAVFHGLSSAVVAVVNAIKRTWHALPTIVAAPLHAAEATVRAVWNAIKKATSTAISAVTGVVRKGFSTIRSAVATAMSTVRGAINSAWHAIEGVFRTGVSTVVSVARTIGGKLRSAVSSVAGIIEAPFRTAVSSAGHILSAIKGKVTGAFSGAAGWLTSTGEDIVRGLIGGIGSMKDDVEHALLALIPGPLKKFAGKLGIGSPSKVFHQYGVWVVQGFNNGIAAEGKKSKATFAQLAQRFKVQGRTLVDSVRKGLGGSASSQTSAIGRISAFANTQLTGTSRTSAMATAHRWLVTLKGDQAAYAKTVANTAAAQARLNQALADQASYASGISDAIKSYNDVTANPTDNIADLLTDLKQRQGYTTTFNANVKKLAALGLNNTSLKQIMDAGVDQGSTVAQAIVSGGKAAIGQINAMTRSTSATGAGLGAFGGKLLYDTGKNSAVQLAQGLLAGARSQEKKVKSYMTNLARTITRTLKKAFKIGSPSRVFADEIGSPLAAGIILGLDNMQGTVDKRLGGLVGLPSQRAGASGSLNVASARTVGARGLGGGATVNVYPRANQSEAAIARATSRELGWAARTA